MLIPPWNVGPVVQPVLMFKTSLASVLHWFHLGHNPIISFSYLNYSTERTVTIWNICGGAFDWHSLCAPSYIGLAKKFALCNPMQALFASMLFITRFWMLKFTRTFLPTQVMTIIIIGNLRYLYPKDHKMGGSRLKTNQCSPKRFLSPEHSVNVKEEERRSRKAR